MIEPITKYDLRVRENIEEHRVFMNKINELINQEVDFEIRFKDIDGNIINLWNEINTIPTKVQNSINATIPNVLKDAKMINLKSDGSNIELLKNRYDGNITVEIIPLSTRSSVGLVTPQDLNALDNAINRIGVLETGANQGSLYYINQIFSGITDTQRDNYFIAIAGRNPTSGDAVIDNQGFFWRRTLTGWAKAENLVIGGGVQGLVSSNLDGKIYIETNFEGSVMGWDILKNRVSALETRTTNIETKNINQDTQITDIINNKLPLKLDKVSTNDGLAKLYLKNPDGSQGMIDVASISGGGGFDSFLSGSVSANGISMLTIRITNSGALSVNSVSIPSPYIANMGVTSASNVLILTNAKGDYATNPINASNVYTSGNNSSIASIPSNFTFTYHRSPVIANGNYKMYAVINVTGNSTIYQTIVCINNTDFKPIKIAPFNITISGGVVSIDDKNDVINKILAWNNNLIQLNQVASSSSYIQLMAYKLEKI